MKKFKKLISVILCFTLIMSTVAVAGITSVFASEDTISAVAKAAKEENVPVIFVPGIGQSQTYLYDDEGNVVSEWNLLNVSTDFKAEDYITIAKVAVPFILSMLAGKNLLKKDNVIDVLTVLFKNCIIDENGNLPENVETPLYNYPVSQYKGHAKDLFFSRIPCQELVDEIGGDNIYYYAYSSFSYTYKVADGLNDYINNVVFPQTGASKVILVPMSMGATVVSAYFDNHAEENDVSKVISIVGAWDGSDVFADLIECKFDEDAPEMVYNGLVAELVGEPYGYLVNLAVRLFPKAVLSDIIRELLQSLCEGVLFKTTSFLSLIPSERYPEIASKYFSGENMKAIKAQTDKYYAYQSNIKENIKELNKKYGIDFYFICGYNMGFGSECSDFIFFQFFDSADETNSDEVIQISSTSVGSSYVKAGTSFLSDYKAVNPECTDPTHNHISPDGSVDASTACFPERTWFFEGQTHELTFNNNALNIAYGIIRNEIDSIQDCTETFPQFNNSRDIKKLTRTYIPDAEAVDRTTITAEQATRLDNAVAEAKKMLKRTINDRENDDKIISELYNALVDIGVYTVNQPKKTDAALTFVFKGLSDIAYKIFGAKGYPDFGK